jgi:hypothetical protein
MNGFVPKKPVKSFLDLEVYQKALECAVFVAKYIFRPSAEVESRPSGLVPLVLSVSKDEGSSEPKVQTGFAATSGNCGSGTAKELIFRNMLPCALGLPHLIAEAHSVRFGGKKDCLILLERAMLHCNKMVVYL